MKSNIYKLLGDLDISSLCERANVSRPTIYQWEKFVPEIFGKFYRVAKVLGVSMEDLFEMEESDLSEYLLKHKELLNDTNKN